jgi:hypothetical protein
MEAWLRIVTSNHRFMAKSDCMVEGVLAERPAIFVNPWRIRERLVR